MSAEINTSEVLVMFNAAKDIGENALEYMALDFHAESTQEAPIQTGTLRSSIQANPQGPHSWIIGTNMEYAGFVHEGYSAFMLDSPVLINGVGWRYIKTHPGYSGKPFFDMAKDTVSGKLDEYLQMALNDAGV